MSLNSGFKKANDFLGIEATLKFLFAPIIETMNWINNALLPEDQETPFGDPTVLTGRGSWIPMPFGTNRVYPIRCFAGNRVMRYEGGVKAGKGGSSSKKGARTPIFYERGVDAIAIGPVAALKDIREGGKSIWPQGLGPITPESHPNGSVVQTDREAFEFFRIYWGDESQTYDALITDHPGPNDIQGKLTPLSGWRNVCYIVWDSKRLGPQPRWPEIQYAVEARPLFSGIASVGPGMINGVNPAHVIAQLLFAANPHGLGLERFFFDNNSIENMASICSSEGLACNLSVEGGKPISQVIGAILADIGFGMTTVEGLITFYPIREPSGNIPNIPLSVVSTKGPEMEIETVPEANSRIAFSFADGDRNYSRSSIYIDDDGNSQYLDGNVSITTKQISIATTLTVASIIAQRRSQEETAPSVNLRITASREARKLFPGQAFVIEGEEEVYRVATIQYQTEDGSVEINAIPDYYGVPASSFSFPDFGGLPVTPITPTEDPVGDIFEPPIGSAAGPGGGGGGGGASGDGGPISPEVVLLRARNDRSVLGVTFYGSADDSDFSEIDYDPRAICAGTVSALNDINSGVSIVENGPTLSMQSPDADADEMFTDLTGNDIDWLRGVQAAICYNASGTASEVIYFRKLEKLGAGSYQMIGCVRYRYSTPSNSSGAVATSGQVYLANFADQGWESITHPFLTIGEPFYWKAAPYTQSTQLSPSLVASTEHTVLGSSVKPSKPVMVRSLVRHAHWAAGEDVELRWSYVHPYAEAAQSGAGMVPAGAAWNELDVPDDYSWRCEFYNEPVGGTLTRTDTVTTPSLTIDAADVATASSGSSFNLFRIVITPLRGTLEGTPHTYIYQIEA